MPRVTPKQRSLSVSSSAPADLVPADLADVVSMSEASSRNIPFDSVIKVFVNISKPNFMLPWQVLTINHACDLALLTVEEPDFWRGLHALSISKSLPELYENTMVIGYPMGGDAICVTRGVVSRVTTLTYEDAKFFLPTRELIAIQLDAAINSGNSGGPALDESGRIVGVAFSGYAGSADNIGYIIPYPVIHNFLADFKLTGGTATICDYGFSFMLCENPSLRAKHKINSPDTGILVTKVSPLGEAAKAGMKPNDVITHIGGVQVGNDGTVEFRRGERLSFKHKIGDQAIGEVRELKILRGGKRKVLKVMGGGTPELVERHREAGSVPTYTIVGGIVFTPLSCGLLDVAVEVLSEEAWQRGRGAMQTPGEQVIMIISILAHDLTHGYDIHRLPLLVELNGEKVLNMRDLVDKVNAVRDGFLEFKLADGKSIILDAKAAREAMPDMLSKYQIPSAVSKDLADIQFQAEPKKQAKRRSLEKAFKAAASKSGKRPLEAQAKKAGTKRTRTRK